MRAARREARGGDSPCGPCMDDGDGMGVWGASPSWGLGRSPSRGPGREPRWGAGQRPAKKTLGILGAFLPFPLTTIKENKRKWLKLSDHRSGEPTPTSMSV